MENIQIKKTIFQIQYKPELQFYNVLFSQKELFDEFHHWQTDKLKIVLKDYDLMHSINIEHNKTTYELDNYQKDIELKFINLIKDNIQSYVNDSKFTRLGIRRIYLLPVKFEHETLSELISIKCFSDNFLTEIDSFPTDNAITVHFKEHDSVGILTFGPIKKDEIPQLLKLNINNHIDPDSIDKFGKIDKILNSYPNVSLYFDYDVSIKFEGKSDMKVLTDFVENNSNPNYKIIRNLKKYLFEDKIK